MIWKTLCDCGNTAYFEGNHLKLAEVKLRAEEKGRSIQSCGCARRIAPVPPTPTALTFLAPRGKNYTGLRFGKLIVLGAVQHKTYGIGRGGTRCSQWLCQCDCGRLHKVWQTNFRTVQSCGCLKRADRKTKATVVCEAVGDAYLPIPSRTIDLTGQRFHRLVALGLAKIMRDKGGSTYFYWDCQCDCGNTAIVRGYSLATGRTKSCGCHSRHVNSVKFRAAAPVNARVSEFLRWSVKRKYWIDDRKDTEAVSNGDNPADTLAAPPCCR